MDIRGWDERYRAEGHLPEEAEAPATKLVMKTAARLSVGKALDLACGTGRNALWLGSEGWQVTALDGSATAIELVLERARIRGLKLATQVVDLTSPSFLLPQSYWDLVVICYYLQRDLLERARNSVKPGGVLLVIVHTTEGSEEPTESRLRPGELEQFFGDWEILHRYEGQPDDPAHKRRVAEVVARRPV